MARFFPEGDGGGGGRTRGIRNGRRGGLSVVEGGSLTPGGGFKKNGGALFRPSDAGGFFWEDRGKGTNKASERIGARKSSELPRKECDLKRDNGTVNCHPARAVRRKESFPSRRLKGSGKKGGTKKKGSA